MYRMSASVVLLQICALFTCHVIASGPRTKRTIGFFENIINSMRETFAPDPPLLPPPDVIAKITKLPYSTHYTYYPSSVRMHIRPVEKHVIYVKPPPSPPQTSVIIRSVPHDGDVIRIRMQKPRNGATIHYEIIPVPVHIHEGALQSFGMPSSGPGAVQAPAPVTENDESPEIPWSMDALPPPLVNSNPSAKEGELTPWSQISGPSAPDALNHQFWQPSANWPSNHPDHQAVSQIGYPFMKKKLIVHPTPKHRQPPANSFFNNNFKPNPFVPSPLHSEISVQPSLELASFGGSQIERRPDGLQIVNRRRYGTEEPKKRRRRDTKTIETDDKSATILSSLPPLVKDEKKNNHTSPLAPNTRKFSTDFPKESHPYLPEIFAAGFTSSNGKLKVNSIASVEEIAVSEALPALMFDFGEYTDNEDADNENNDEADSVGANSNTKKSFEKFSDDHVKIVKAEDWLAEPLFGDFLSTTPQRTPTDYTRQFSGSTKSKLSGNSRSGSPSFLTRTHSKNQARPKTSHTQKSERNEQNGQWQSYFDSPKFFFSADQRELNFPETGSFSNLRPKEPSPNFFEDLFRSQGEPNDFGFVSKQEEKTGPRFDYDNIEYFEPIIIDIDKNNESEREKLKNIFKSSVIVKQPLKMPVSLHETVDNIKKISLHPPIFDLDQEGNENLFTIADRKYKLKQS